MAWPTARIRAAALLLVGLLGLAGPGLAAPLPEAVVLGVPTSLTLLEGRESLMAVRLAVEEINAAGGVRIGGRRLPLKVVSHDLRGAALGVAVEDAVASLGRFLENPRLSALVVGPFRSEVLLNSMDLLAKRGIPLLGTIAMTPASEAMVLKHPAYRNIFRVGLNTRYLVDYLISSMHFLEERFGFKRVYILNQDVAWARTTASKMIRLFFRRAGWHVLGQKSFPSGARDFSQALEEARAQGAQALLCIFDSPHSGRLAHQWRRLKVPALLCGFVSPLVGSDAWREFDGQVAGSLNVIFELGNVPSRRYPPAAAFYQAFQRRWGMNVQSGHGPAPSYEAVYILAQAMERAGTLEPSALVTALEATDRQGCMGRVRFHPDHQAYFGQDPRREALAAVIQWTPQGQRRIVFPPAIAEGDIELPAFVPTP
ncbi:MAG: ABC transporter substrate-binding protein [Desulfarculus sp.]|nr:ABC transporter substrate-binding protein [Pseudomonadota bacterium]MBV1717903.1 ABC transporter substrate-binding protein [Desulfarculus sp.]MBU4574459.1 ABC transporter substrate-binding protein [Pseudomonadota bacterium]MBU4597448.1 ABC transporter substrate-binding protein [Pseudomonadota bacterium]MBV1737766.1 ABC transporter substrate-binding protein [Desulfarculus sp.]